MVGYKYIALIILVLWILGLSTLYLFFSRKKIRLIGELFLITGVLISVLYITLLWINLERAPLKTLGETRLWYSFFVPLLGLIIYYRWKIKWMPLFSFFLAGVFVLINVFRPENFDKALMPALQSVWFVPHVIVYIFAYALLAVSTLFALKGLWQIQNKRFDNSLLDIADNIVYIGFAFLTFGLLFGALWAKEAWGHYWTWDPKETWAFLTWLLYLLYIHFRHRHKERIKISLWILSIAFIILLICWFGINYLPSAQNSVHVYSNG
ncbi:MAG: cytochrome C assembly protein [Bacteroidetes bacterium RIFOXYA12_FULL_35_11]|nr:MAG: cytochrome C assembly protein [Bacteroidetes bacterium GWF2_35_48]OFY72570.1 MAG: cytochrome C assembly protein [Bacteroidetes bacterium RIFOXYA12_FULL_35_11]OFZ04511.1 MAG: cytochrome C assembly protein [Bacteroidetes bacterium RIFOXYC12_FULL_35_7]HBX49550.1 cytochrome C assembly protein [Bacteroidales bacterium]